MVINSVTVSTCLDAADVLSDKNFGSVLQLNFNVSHVKVLNTHNFSCRDSGHATLTFDCRTFPKVSSDSTLAASGQVDTVIALISIRVSLSTIPGRKFPPENP